MIFKGFSVTDNNEKSSNASKVPNKPVTVPQSQSPTEDPEENVKQQQIYKLVQLIHMAQAQVQIEASEIQKSQKIAEVAQQNLEDSVNNVKILTAALHAGQENVAMNAIKAQNSQLQLAAHDQLLFEARQKVDRLSAELVTSQAELGVSDTVKGSVNVKSLIEKLKQPLNENETPKPVPSLLQTNDPTVMQYFPPKTAGNHKRNVGNFNAGNKYDSLSAEDIVKLMAFLKTHQRTIENNFEIENS